MKRGTLLLLIIVTLVGLGAALAASVMHNGLSAKANPSALEAWVARNVRHLAVPDNAREAANPVADSADVQHDGAMHFADHCSTCHGNDGSGETMLGRGMYPKPPDLRAANSQKLSDGELFWIVENGVRFTGMPAFGTGEHGSSEDSWKLVRFIRHLPQLTVPERMEMEKMNPKGPDDRQEDKEEEDFLNGTAPAKQPAEEHHHH